MPKEKFVPSPKCQCPECAGKGYVYQTPQRDPNDDPRYAPTPQKFECPKCDGWGEIYIGDRA